MTASVPTSRDAVVQRLRGTLTAKKLCTGSPALILASLRSGKIGAPKSVEEFGAFASAVQGLPDDFNKAGDGLKRVKARQRNGVSPTQAGSSLTE